MPYSMAPPTMTMLGIFDSTFHVSCGRAAVCKFVLKPSCSNGTDERYKTEVPPTSCSPQSFGTYFPGSALIRSYAILISSSRSPNVVAPVGHASAHAVGRPLETRCGHRMHLCTRGNVLFHS